MSKIRLLLLVCLVSCQTVSRGAEAPLVDTGALPRPAPLLIDAAFLADHGLNGDTYYVSEAGSDKNAGTSAEQAFATIQKGVDAAQPGDTVAVMDGVYTARFPKNVVDFYKKSGTPKHWILLTAYPGQHPRIEFTGWDGITVQGSSYIVVNGFVVRGNAANISLATARQYADTMTNPAIMGGGISVNRCWNDPSAHSTHVIVANNIVYDCCAGGISTDAADYVQIRGNVVYGNSFYAPNDTSGISMYQNWNSDANTGVKMIVTGNISFGNENLIPFIFTTPRRVTDGNGIIVDDSKNTQRFAGNEEAGPYAGQTLIENNLCFDNGGKGLNIYESSHVTAKNNTFYFNLKHRDLSGGEITVGDSDDVDLEENIAVARGKGKPGTLPFQALRSTDVSVAESLFFGGPADVSASRGNIFADPLFVHPSTDALTADFGLRPESPARGLGASLR